MLEIGFEFENVAVFPAELLGPILSPLLLVAAAAAVESNANLRCEFDPLGLYMTA